MGRGAVAALLLGGWVGWGCSVSNAFTCAQDSQCGDGVCQPTGGCSFPDDTCPSGQRYGDFAPDGLGGLCVDPAADTESGGTTLGSGDATSTSTTFSGPSSLDDTGTQPDTTTSEIDASSSTDGRTTDPLTTGPTSSDAGSDDGSSSSNGDPNVDPSLLIWLRFDDGQVDPLTNSGAFGEDVACAPALMCPDFVSGVDGDAGSFGGNAGVAVPHEDVLSLPDEFTIAAWLRSGPLDNSPHSIVAKAFEAGNFNSFNFVFTSGVDGDPGWEVALYLNTTSTADNVYADFDYPEDAWVHVTAVWDGTFASIYINGDLFAGQQLPQPGFDDNPITIGFDVNAGTPAQFYNGAIDDLRLYSRALDDAEIAELATP